MKTDPEAPNVVYFKKSYKDDAPFKKIYYEIDIPKNKLQQLYIDLLPLKREV